MTNRRSDHAARLARFLLALYPREFQDRYGKGVLETFLLRARARAGAALPRYSWFLIREYVGLGIGALLQRVSMWRSRKHNRSVSENSTPPLGMTMNEFLTDLKHATRRLVKAPAFSAATVTTLGLGIGAITAVFSVVYSVVLNPLPYPESDNLVWLSHSAPGLGAETELSLTPGIYTVYRDQNRTLEAVALFQQGDAPLNDGVDPERVRFAQVTSTFAEVFRVPPLLGRWIDKDDRYGGGVGVVVLSEGFWSRRYGSDAAVLGRTIELAGIPHEVVGVMPTRFTFPERETQVWVPNVLPQTPRFGGFTDWGVARLRSGVTTEDAADDLNSLIPRLPEIFPGRSAKQVVEVARIGAMVTPLKDQVVGSVERTLWIVLGTMGLVLAIALSNVANLILVRAESRQREVAVRTALGASRGALGRYVLAESTILAVGGVGLGLILAFWGVRLLVASGPSSFPRLHEVGIHGPVLVFASLVAIAVSLAFTAIPVLSRSPELVLSLKEGGRAATTGRRRFRARHTLVASQLALALILLVGSGLMVRSFWHLKNVDPGFRSANVLTFRLGLPGSDYADRSVAASFQQQLLDKLEALPGVMSAGAVSCLPLSGWCGGNPVYQEGVPPDPDAIPPIVALRSAAPGYFETIGIPLVAGRFFERADHEQAANVVVVSEKLVDLYWPGESAIGRNVNDGGSTWYTIVGVVGDVQTGGLKDDRQPQIYFPMVSGGNRGPGPNAMTIVLRTVQSPLGLASAARAAVNQLDPNLPIANVQTLEQLLSGSRIQTAFTMVLLVIAALVALALGAVGVYGVIAYVVGQRRNEIGVRMALGATGNDVLRMVLRQSGVVALIGIMTGLGGAFALTRVMQTVLFDVSPADPLTYTAVSLLLLGVALLSSYLPARRAAGMDPVEALRAE